MVVCDGNIFEIYLQMKKIVMIDDRVYLRRVWQNKGHECTENTSNGEIITDLKSDVELIDVQIQSQIEQQIH